jgi:prophage maintenance system killer protein
MLGINGWELTVSNDDAYELVIAVAEGHMREVNDVAKALMAGSQRVS